MFLLLLVGALEIDLGNTISTILLRPPGGSHVLKTSSLHTLYILCVLYILCCCIYPIFFCAQAGDTGAVESFRVMTLTN